MPFYCRIQETEVREALKNIENSKDSFKRTSSETIIKYHTLNVFFLLKVWILIYPNGLSDLIHIVFVFVVVI